MTKYLLVEVHRYIHRYDNIEIRIRMIREPFVYGRQVSGERREARGERREEVGLLNDIRVFCMTKTTSHKSHIIRVLLVDSKSRLSVSILLVPLSLSLSLSRAFSLSLSLSLSPFLIQCQLRLVVILGRIFMISHSGGRLWRISCLSSSADTCSESSSL